MSLSGEQSINEVIGDVTRGLVSASTEKEIQQRVCEQFAASELYSFAWIGRYASENKEVIPSVAAGIAENLIAISGVACCNPRPRGWEGQTSDEIVEELK